MLFYVNTRDLVSEGSSSPDLEIKAFRILAIYDSVESSREAARASAVVLRELGEDVVVHKNSWDAEALEDAAVRDRAAAEAAQADVIVIAVADMEPTTVMRKWAEAWQKNRLLASGLLALIPCNDLKSGGDLTDFLYETAVSANMDFLCRKPRRF
jgi:hypothetical protein